MHELINSLQQYHHEKAHVLSQIDSLVLEIGKREQSARTELRALLESFHSGAESAHHHNEELILLELRKTAVPIHRLIENISEEHAAFHRILGRLNARVVDSSISCEVVSSDIIWFARQYDEHATAEETIFFPAADNALSSDAWSRVEKAWRR